MDSTASTTKWWRWPIYVAAAIVLALIAISSALSTAKDGSSPSDLGPNLSLNASKVLRQAGFSGMATLLSISPEYYSSASLNITIFALTDSALANVSRSPWVMKDFLRYHALPLRLSMVDLAKEPGGTCLPTLSPGKNLLIKRSEAKGNQVVINDVPVKNPDLFLEEKVVIHGIHEPFAFLGIQGMGRDWVLMPLPLCNPNLKVVSDVSESKQQRQEKEEEAERVGWALAIRFLKSYGFIPFAVQLKSVVDLDRTLEYGKDLTSFTIFAPQDFQYMPSETPMLDNIVRAHILPGKYDYLQLLALSDRASLKTLVPGLNLEVDVIKIGNAIAGVAVNGMEITDPEAFMSEKFIIHGIPQAFHVKEFLNTST
ncbi:fasciclin-like arabinogalactan protein 21 [Punica granatum]|uniref:Fasciclin-like arabinogalactan protein 21 n=2 Tax=Punica granatum TaxID=22663 RepID=A0A218Y2A8_PUNGR|nr:fasciclin-like arabinogalactan protein 21 [Punica granatum]OWM90969.1 hypothetical protein CDL15_Pgr023302 [Punica granatum]